MIIGIIIILIVIVAYGFIEVGRGAERAGDEMEKIDRFLEEQELDHEEYKEHV